MRISDWSSDVCSSDLPVASGRVSVKKAWAWLITLCLVGLVVLLQLPLLAQAIALGSLALVAAYPFMKRITWWPQAWLGLVFTWGALVGWPAATGRFDWPALALYAGAFWRSEEHTSELQSLMRISYAVFCLNKKTNNKDIHTY